MPFWFSYIAPELTHNLREANLLNSLSNSETIIILEINSCESVFNFTFAKKTHKYRQLTGELPVGAGRVVEDEYGGEIRVDGR